MQLVLAPPTSGDSFCDWIDRHCILVKAKRSVGRLLPAALPAKSHESEREKAAAISYSRSVRALPIRLVTVRKNFDAGVESVLSHYVSKVKRYCLFEDIQVRTNPKNTSNIVAQMEAESDRVLKAIAPRDWVVLVDERGRDVTSEQLATLIAEAGDRGSSALVFCIGGPHGHGSHIRKRANASIRLSSMVLNHQVATIVLMEQIYRAWTILKRRKVSSLRQNLFARFSTLGKALRHPDGWY